MEETNKAKSSNGSLKHLIKFDKTLEKINYQYQGEKGIITVDTERIIRQHYERFNSNKFNNLDEMGKLLTGHN